jgi:hypothetical protein
LESSLKVKRLERDIPKYIRSQDQWQQELFSSQSQEEGEEERSFKRESIEDLLTHEAENAYLGD